MTQASFAEIQPQFKRAVCTADGVIHHGRYRLPKESTCGHDSGSLKSLLSVAGSDEPAAVLAGQRTGLTLASLLFRQ
jgi:hypothetical protein